MKINRQNSVGISDDELGVLLEQIVEFCGLDWLTKKTGHPLQELWGRQDFLSTVELALFAHALKILRQTDEPWVKRQVKTALGNNKNNRIGAFFEIIGLSYLTVNGQLLLSKESNPGYDAKVRFHTGGEINFSLKHYGTSQHKLTFDQHALEIEEVFKRILSGRKRIPTNCIIINEIEHPSSSDWSTLKKGIQNTLKQYSGKHIISQAGKWVIFLGPMDESRYDTSALTYTFVVLAPYHNNEEKNLISKIEDACSNISLQSPVQNEDTINMVYIKIPLTGSMKTCTQWTNSYFQQHPDKPISAVLLYQPALIQNPKLKTSMVNHSFGLVTNGALQKWNLKNPVLPFKFSMLVGGVSTEQSQECLIIDGRMIRYEGKYIYQSGDHFFASTVEPDGSITGNMEFVAPGIRSHVVMTIPGQKKKMVLTGKFAPSDKFEIL